MGHHRFAEELGLGRGCGKRSECISRLGRWASLDSEAYPELKPAANLAEHLSLWPPIRVPFVRWQFCHSTSLLNALG